LKSLIRWEFQHWPVAPNLSVQEFYFAYMAHCMDCRLGNLMLLRKIILSSCAMAMRQPRQSIFSDFMVLFELCF